MEAHLVKDFVTVNGTHTKSWFIFLSLEDQVLLLQVSLWAISLTSIYNFQYIAFKNTFNHSLFKLVVQYCRLPILTASIYSQCTTVIIMTLRYTDVSIYLETYLTKIPLKSYTEVYTDSCSFRLRISDDKSSKSGPLFNIFYRII